MILHRLLLCGIGAAALGGALRASDTTGDVALNCSVATFAPFKGARCGGLQQAAGGSAAECAGVCCFCNTTDDDSTPSCTVWQWGNNSCWVGNVPASGCERAAGWVGGATVPVPVPPPPPPPPPSTPPAPAPPARLSTSLPRTGGRRWGIATCEHGIMCYPHKRCLPCLANCTNNLPQSIEVSFEAFAEEGDGPLGNRTTTTQFALWFLAYKASCPLGPGAKWTPSAGSGASFVGPCGNPDDDGIGSEGHVLRLRVSPPAANGSQSVSGSFSVDYSDGSGHGNCTFAMETVAAASPMPTPPPPTPFPPTPPVPTPPHTPPYMREGWYCSRPGSQTWYEGCGYPSNVSTCQFCSLPASAGGVPYAYPNKTACASHCAPTPAPTPPPPTPVPACQLCELKSAAECGACANRDGDCSWCVSAAPGVPSACFYRAEAEALPAEIFQCASDRALHY